jgi:carbamoyl-phosphate synthase large subunit
MLPDDLLIQAKQDGFADRYLAKLLDIPEGVIREPQKPRCNQAWAAGAGERRRERRLLFLHLQCCRCGADSNRRKIMVLGGGPNRIGQGIEFDYCCVHAAFALRDEGYESIMVNCNPETVSTDYDTSDKLYFRTAHRGRCAGIYEKEKPEGRGAVRRPDPPQHRRELGSGRGGSSAPAPTPSIWPRTGTVSAA